MRRKHVEQISRSISTEGFNKVLRLYEALTRKLSAFYAVYYFRGRRQRMHIGKSQMHSARLTARAKMFARARGTPQRERERVTCNNNTLCVLGLQ